MDDGKKTAHLLFSLELLTNISYFQSEILSEMGERITFYMEPKLENVFILSPMVINQAMNLILLNAVDL